MRHTRMEAFRCNNAYSTPQSAGSPFNRRIARRCISRFSMATVALLFCFNAVAHCQERQELRRTYELRPGAIVALQNVSGDIAIDSWGQSQVEIVAIKTGPADQLSQVDISIDAQPSRLGIRTIYPERGGNNRVSVSYTLKVPSSVSLDSIQSVSGNIHISNIDGRVVARSVSGDVTAGRVGQDADVDSVSGDAKVSDVGGRASVRSVSGDVDVSNVSNDLEAKSVSGDVVVRQIRGYVSAESVSGDIAISDSDPTNLKASTTSGDIQFSGSLSANGRYELKSHSGTVNVALPSGSGFALQASTFSGQIDTSFEVRVQGPQEKRSLAGVVGQGGPALELRSFSGNILIRKSK
jgi:DUF4097 and DUF4098 domain-containing protein YvlB